ncbi:hypothetical protein ACJRPK_16035 [Aquimarina sp. 2-A2]|uniref:hypothetical protein n=1 Tax=Aquimarina sp. 2-A2 TaxID=3382644 RepID=UPI00387F2F56
MKHFYLLILTLLLTCTTFAGIGDKAKTKSNTATTTTPVLPPVQLQRSFGALDQAVNTQLKELSTASTVRDFSQHELYTRFEMDTTVNALRSEAKTVIDELVAENKFLESLTDYLTGETPVTLPIGIKKEIGSSEFIMGVSKIKLGKDYSELEIFVRLKLPQIDETGQQKELFFGASGVKLSHKGGLFGSADLVLLGDFPVRLQGKSVLMVLQGGYDLKTGNLDKKTYVTIDCDGFKELGIAANVEFSREKILPVTAANEIDNSTIGDTKIKKKVTTSFELVASDWNDVLVEINLPRFQIPSLKNTIFEVNTAVFDFSDVRNSAAIKWPEGYQEKYLISGEENIWQGVYVESLTVVLPKQFEEQNNSKRISFGAEKLIIDNNGVSGTFSANNVLPLDKGSAGGWQFSVDSFKVIFVAGTFAGGGFGGKMVLPVSTYQGGSSDKSDTTALDYTALIDASTNEYTLTASPTESLGFDLFKARATITENSIIELKLDDGKFRPKAILHGNMAIKGSNNGSKSSTATADFEGILFEHFQLQTVSPKLKIGYAGYKGEVKVGSFPASISEIAIRADGEIAALDFTIAINLMDSDGGFSGATSLSVEGELGENQGLEKWKFKRIRLRRIDIAADVGFLIEGFVEFRENDPIYGDGFSGQVKATFKGGIAVTINATFGKTTFRYWYVDGLVEGLHLVIPTGFVVTGFGGGASYRMRKDGYSSNMGIGTSGVKYVPDENSGLGVKAMMLFEVTGGGSAVNGGFGFEIAFNRHGGINRISLYGEAHMLQTPGYDDAGDEMGENLGGIVENESQIPDGVENQLKESNLIEASKAIYPATMTGQKGLNAYVAIEFDFTQDTFHGTFELYIDVFGGVFKGVGAGGRAGWAVVHFGPGEWYIHVGTPTDPIGLKVGIGSVALTAKSYFMMGDYMPASPPPPAQVAKILGMDAAELDYMRDENALRGGRGIAFGSSFDFDTGDMTFLFLYARFNAGFGFDIMVKDYGDTICRGSGQIGVNGWYANGQSYVYLQGSMGIKFKLFGKRKRIPIIEAGAATLMQAKLPNPVWIKGYLGGYYNVLGGLVKGRFRFEMQFGEECDIISGGSPLGDIKIIADVKPRKDMRDVDVFAVPQVSFNMAVGSTIRIEDEEYKVHEYRFKLDDFWLKDNSGRILRGEQSWNEHNDLLSFTSTEVLPPEEQLSLFVSVAFEEKINGRWTPVTHNGELLKEDESLSFTTGTAPDYIPLTNIEYCYPVIEQQYFLPKEHPNGYIKLKRGQEYLFQLQAGWAQRAYLIDDNEKATESNLSYNVGQKQVNFSLPEMSNSMEYQAVLLTLPPAAAKGSVNSNYKSKDLGNGNTVETKSNTIEGLTTNPETIEMLSYSFATSEHDSFSAKMKDKKFRSPLREIIYADVHKLKAVVRKSEPFDKVELSGNQYSGGKALVKVEAILSNNTYYEEEVYPLVYKDYPINDSLTVDRDISIMGLPPKKGMDQLTWYHSYLESQPSSDYLDTRMPHTYNLPIYFKRDFIDIQYKVVNAYLNDPDTYATEVAKYDYIINGRFPYIKKGNYNSKYQYVLPGGKAGTRSNFMYVNPN